MKSFIEKKQRTSFQFWAAMTVFFVFAFFSVLSFSTNIFSAKAAIAPSIITYQGKILNNGSAVTTTQSMKFFLYDAAEVGNLLYTASGTLFDTESISVTPSSGIFSVNLGGNGTNALDPSMFAENETVYLEVVIEDQTLVPRKQFTSAPFALNSAYLMGFSATTTSNTTYIPVSNANGNFEFRGTSQGVGVGQGLVYINPPAAGVNETLFGISVNDIEQFRVDAEGDVSITGAVSASTGTLANALMVGGDTFVVDGANNRVGINTSTPGYTLAVSGTSYFENGKLTVVGNRANPTFLDKIEDGDEGGAVQLVSPTVIDIAGNYAFIAAENSLGIEIVDISDPTNLRHVIFLGGIPVSGVAVSGDYLYIAGDGKLKVIDISNIEDLKTVGVIEKDVRNVQVTGKYVYGITTNSFLIVDTSRPLDPILISEISDGDGGVVELDFPGDFLIDGKYAYITSQTGNTLEILDISDPFNPVHVSSLSHGVGGFILDGANGIDKQEEFLFVTSLNSSTLQVINVLDPKNPTNAGSYTDNAETQMNGPWDVVVVDDYAYVSAYLSEAIQVLDVSDPANITAVNALTDGLTQDLDGVRDLELDGNILYAAVSVGNKFQAIDISGVKIYNADIGAARIDEVQVLGEARFNKSVDIRGGLRIGSNGLLLNGDLGIQAHTTTTIATNTINFSHTALFSSAAHASSTHAFIFDTANALPVTSTVYLLSLRNNNTPVFSVATNGDVHTTGTYYGEAIAVTTPGSPGDLAEQVDIRPDQAVEPGDLMMVDPEGDDRYMMSEGENISTIAGVISTKPTITLGSGKTEKTAVMALVGRVPLKVSNQNGFIERGDILVSSDIPGHAMKYDSNSSGASRAAIIGTALENQSLDKPTGKILALIRSGWTGGIQSGSKNTFSGSDYLYKGQVFIEFTPEQQALIGESHNIRVQVTLNGQANGIYVSNKWRTGFQVKEAYDSGSNAGFDWQVEIISSEDGEFMREPPDGSSLISTPIDTSESLEEEPVQVQEEHLDAQEQNIPEPEEDIQELVEDAVPGEDPQGEDSIDQQ